MTDIEIAHSKEMLDIGEIADKLNIASSIERYGNTKAKIVSEEIQRADI